MICRGKLGCRGDVRLVLYSAWGLSYWGLFRSVVTSKKLSATDCAKFMSFSFRKQSMSGMEYRAITEKNNS